MIPVGLQAVELDYWLAHFLFFEDDGIAFAVFHHRCSH